jgi:RNA recognition motif-containing protein
MEHPDDQLQDDSEDPVKSLASFITKQAEKKLAMDNSLGSVFESNNNESSSILEVKPQLYVAPKPTHSSGIDFSSIRNDRGGDSSDSTIRVSNLTKAVTEDDLRDLFGRFGRIHRISVPRSERIEDGVVIKEPRGFAYIAFYSRDDAELAMTRLQGYGYDHLIIKLEWAKANKDSGGGGGLNGNFVSGYGMKLAQDTTEKAVFTSHGNK